jgi:hypothetical protein
MVPREPSFVEAAGNLNFETRNLGTLNPEPLNQM